VSSETSHGIAATPATHESTTKHTRARGHDADRMRRRIKPIDSRERSLHPVHGESTDSDG
jgi:hypothetical protein